MKSILKQIKVSFERETPLFAMLKIFRYGFYLLRSLPLRWSLNAPGLYIGPKFLLLGTKYLQIGRNFYAHSNLWIEAIPEYKEQIFTPSITIGDNVSMGDAVHISCNTKIHIGNHVLFGSNVFVGDHQHGRYSGSDQTHSKLIPSHRPLSVSLGIEIGDNTWIANNVVITGGVTIGRGCIIAANSVVNQDIADGMIAAGSPARAIKRFDAVANAWIKL
jgi:acetyltransferase-like isoleucine patch superfamily enzyme